MAYRAFEKMQQQIEDKYKISGMPVVPTIEASTRNGDLAKYALRFLRTSCEDLRFTQAVNSSKLEESELRSFKDRSGRSYTENQIPILMEMDIDRLCLEYSLNEFLKDPTTQNAYLVYYCYLQMFMKPESEGTRSIIEMLSEFEQKVSPLTLKHRDHFVHTIFVFTLGLAIYEYSALYRKAYKEKFNLCSEKDTAHHFLQFWGFTALFHDVGYPFELAYTQISDYFSSQKIPSFYVSYRQPDENTAPVPSSTYQPLYNALMPKLPRVRITSPTTNELFAASLTASLYPKYNFCAPYQEYLSTKKPGGHGKTDSTRSFYEFLKQQFTWKPTEPEKCNNFMDHAYFSGYLMLHQLWHPGQKSHPDKDYLEALTAILLHNSLFKHTILKDAALHASYPTMEIETHPLAYMLMLCDELQCWDRFGYGRNTKRENDPVNCKLKMHPVTTGKGKGSECITLTYYFDKNRNDMNGTLQKLQGDSKSCSFIQDIEKLVQINKKDTLGIKIASPEKTKPDTSKEPLSRIDFLQMYRLALLLHGEYLTRKDYTHDTDPSFSADDFSVENLQNKFQMLSLEYQLANLHRVQRFASHLDREDIFFSDRSVSFPELGSFSKEQLDRLGTSEHKAWSQRKKAMGWRSGKDYTSKGLSSYESNNLRECLRQHQYLNYSFDRLSIKKKRKDTIPFKQMQAYMKKHYQIKLFSLRREKKSI